MFADISKLGEWNELKERLAKRPEFIASNPIIDTTVVDEIRKHEEELELLKSTSYYAEETVYEKLKELRGFLEDHERLKYIHRIDNVLFMHGGLTDEFLKAFSKASHYNDVDAVISEINELGRGRMWQNYSPIWLRPQYGNYRMYKPRKLLQVVGHTPVKEIKKEGNVISCDTFSTYRNGDPFGTMEFLLLDTETWSYKGVSSGK